MVVAQETDASAETVRIYHLMDATELRGEQLRLRISVRSGDSTGNSAAFGWLQFDGAPADGPGQEQRTGSVTSPEWSVALGRVAALVTNEGGTLSHPAIIARELGVSAVVGAADATLRISTGDRVCVDPIEGTVSLLRS